MDEWRCRSVYFTLATRWGCVVSFTPRLDIMWAPEPVIPVGNEAMTFQYFST
jgi:hypothetical protein